jgi:hypothetical protein
MAVTKQSIQGEGALEARADTSTPDQSGRQAMAISKKTTDAGFQPEPTTYRYIGMEPALTRRLKDCCPFHTKEPTTYEFRTNELVHLAHPDKLLDDHPDFERVEEAG